MSSPFDFSEFPQLTTERLLLRRMDGYDHQAMFDLFSDADVTRYNDVDRMHTMDEAVAILDWCDSIFREKRGLRWAITLHDNPHQMIGTCGYNVWDRRNDRGVIGYDLMPTFWGQGIIPEAVQAMIAFGFEQMQLNRIEADVTVGNQASIRVLEKCGFLHEGVMRQRGHWKGIYHDLHLFSLLRDEWDHA